MVKHLKDIDVEKVLGLLDGWKDELSWDSLCSACPAIIGIQPSRQTLYRIPRIQDAFQATKERLRDGISAERTVPNVRIAMQRIARLEAENERLKRENNKLLEQFVVWQYSAHIYGMKDFELNQAQPTIDLGNTE